MCGSYLFKKINYNWKGNVQQFLMSEHNKHNSNHILIWYIVTFGFFCLCVRLLFVCICFCAQPLSVFCWSWCWKRLLHFVYSEYLVLFNSCIGIINSGFQSSTVMTNLLQCLNPLLFTDSDAEETTVVLTKGPEVKRITGRGNETAFMYRLTSLKWVI